MRIVVRIVVRIACITHHIRSFSKRTLTAVAENAAHPASSVRNFSNCPLCFWGGAAEQA